MYLSNEYSYVPRLKLVMYLGYELFCTYTLRISNCYVSSQRRVLVYLSECIERFFIYKTKTFIPAGYPSMFTSHPEFKVYYPSPTTFNLFTDSVYKNCIFLLKLQMYTGPMSCHIINGIWMTENWSFQWAMTCERFTWGCHAYNAATC